MVVFAIATTGAVALTSGRMLTSSERALVNALHPSTLEHTDQDELNAIADAFERFTLAFERGDELFGHPFNAFEGGGSNIGDGGRFTRIPRADRPEWRDQFPARPTGPNAQACIDCHNVPVPDGAGLINSNVIRDPQHAGQPGRMIQRNTPSLLGQAGLQVLAEEMTDDLLADREEARQEACRNGSGSDELDTKGVNFGRISARRIRISPCEVTFDTSQVRGVGTDLVVRAFQWKGTDLNVRQFVRTAMNNELGVQPVEIVGGNRGGDGDGDGVTNELSVGDITALAVYISAQPRPTTRQELASLGVIPPLSTTENSAINNGRTIFSQIGCATCHIPSLTTSGRTFREPSLNPNFRETAFPGGQNAEAEGVLWRNPVQYDITRDLPDNRITLPGTNGDLLGSFRRSGGGARIELFGDLKRHFMGNELAENIDEAGTGAATFMTENLWGVGSTAPYLHDGRATTLTEAILYHGGDAASSRANFNSLSTTNKRNLIAFLSNLVLFMEPEEE